MDVTLQGDPNLFEQPNVVYADEGGVRVASATVPVTGKAVLRVTLRPQGHKCVVRFTVGRTLVPAAVLGPASTDTRRLGTHFNSFAYRR